MVRYLSDVTHYVIDISYDFNFQINILIKYIAI